MSLLYKIVLCALISVFLIPGIQPSGMADIEIVYCLDHPVSIPGSVNEESIHPDSHIDDFTPGNFYAYLNPSFSNHSHFLPTLSFEIKIVTTVWQPPELA
jgi:hypothetical protein